MSLMPKFPNYTSVYIPRAHTPRITAKFRVRVTNKGHRIVSYMGRWENEFLRRAGGAIRTYVIRAFKVVQNKSTHSTQGTPPFLHMPKNEFIRGAVQYKVDYQLRRTLIGTAYSVAKLWGWKHEHGEQYGKSNNVATRYPKRPFMMPQFRRWWKIGRPAIMYSIRKKIQSGF